MPEQEKKTQGQLILLHAFVDSLALAGHPELDQAIEGFRKLLKGMDPLSSYKLFNLKMKSLLAMRDQVLQGQANKATASSEWRGPIDEIIENALDLLEKASKSTATYSNEVGAAIEQLKLAKDIVKLRNLSKHLLDTSSHMAEAGKKFQGDIGTIAHGLIHYKQRIEELETELREQKKLMVEDSLTKVFNRGAFDQRFKLAVSDAERFSTPLCLLMIDMDHFKKINDTHGHQVGDDVLVNLAALLKKSLKNGESVYRFGGDEFAVIFPNVRLEQAASFTERLQRYVEEKPYRYKNIKFRMSLSGGLTSFRKGDTRGSFFERADQLLYQAKQTGRGRIRVD